MINIITKKDIQFIKNEIRSLKALLKIDWEHEKKFAEKCKNRISFLENVLLEGIY